LSATLIFKRLAVLALATALAAPLMAQARDPSQAPPEAAFEAAMVSLKAGDVDKALPGLEQAAAHGVFLAQFYLARVFSDNAGSHTDHAKAYILYQRIADEFADIDPDDDQRAPFVAKSLTALAEYVRDGISEIGLEPQPDRATEYLQHAATFFNDPDAQFELAKLFLRAKSGEESEEDVKRAMHWLSVLTEQGHAPAQAFLADLYWRGEHVPPDRKRALALISVAVENAPASERVWIEDIYQNIFCGASTALRGDAASMASDWRRRFGRPNETIDYAGLAPLGVSTVRTCGNGEPVAAIAHGSAESSRGSISTSSLRAAEPGPTGTPAQGGAAPGGVIGIDLRQSDAGGSVASH
jgi:TPR repeat protein